VASSTGSAAATATSAAMDMGGGCQISVSFLWEFGVQIFETY